MTRLTALFASLLTLLLLATGCTTYDNDAGYETSEASEVATAAQMALAQNEYLEAQHLYARASEMNPFAWQYHLGAGRAAVKAGNIGIAEAHYEAALQLLTEDVEAEAQSVANTATVLFLLGREEAAKDLLVQTRDQNPQDPTLKELLEEWEDNEEELAEYRIR